MIGARSRSFRFLVRLIERMPVLALPAWRDNRTAPVDGRDMLAFLARAADAPAALAGSWDIGGPDVMTYAEMIARIADALLVRRPSLGLDVSLTPVTAAVAAAIAGEDPALIGPLMESLEHDLLPRDDRAAPAVRRAPAPLRRGGRARAARVGAHGGAGRAMTAVTASIEIDVPPDRVWDVIMDPQHFGDWVTIHRKLGSVDRGDLREGYKVEQTLCLHRANFRVKWSLARCDAPHHAIWEGKGPAGSRARIEDTLVALDGGRRTRFDYRNEYSQPGRLPRPHGRARAGRGRRRARGQPVAAAAQGVPRALTAGRRAGAAGARSRARGRRAGSLSMRQFHAAAPKNAGGCARPGSASHTSPAAAQTRGSSASSGSTLRAS